MYFWIPFGFDSRTIAGYVSSGEFHAWNSIRFIDENGDPVEVIADATFASAVKSEDINLFISPNIPLRSNNEKSDDSSDTR